MSQLPLNCEGAVPCAGTAPSLVLHGAAPAGGCPVTFGLVLAVGDLVAGPEEADVEVVATVALVNDVGVALTNVLVVGAEVVVSRDHHVVTGTADEEVNAVGAAGHGVVAAVAHDSVTASAAVEV